MIRLQKSRTEKERGRVVEMDQNSFDGSWRERERRGRNRGLEGRGGGRFRRLAMLL